MNIILYSDYTFMYNNILIYPYLSDIIIPRLIAARSARVIRISVHTIVIHNGVWFIIFINIIIKVI